jgi:isochorismate pyruvate lyase
MKCKSLDEVRENIDRIDKEIVKLIAKRSKYVVEAASFKKDEEDVKASKRVEMVINKVKTLAQENNVDSYIVEIIYRTMISSFINFELSEYKKLGAKEAD